jgi:hypothetical protein
MGMADEKPKIIIDEDWKAQVQREKEEARTKTKEDQAEGGQEEARAAEQVDASFGALLQSLATQCMFALGLIAPQDAKTVTVDIPQAKFVIDTLLMLRQKTQGNLSKEEEGALKEAIAELQRVYVARAQQQQEAALKQSGIDVSDLKNPEA